jgi:hypothetical protein
MLSETEVSAGGGRKEAAAEGDMIACLSFLADIGSGVVPLGVGSCARGRVRARGACCRCEPRASPGRARGLSKSK